MSLILLDYKGAVDKFGQIKGLEVLAFDENGQRTLPKKDSDKQCNGKIHRQLRYCSKPAGWGTDHAGKGRCKLHGGCATGRKSGELRYSDSIPSDLVEKYEEFAVEANVDIKSLNDEIALVRSKISFLEGSNVQGSNDRMVLNFSELLRRFLETKQKVEEGVKKTISIEIAVNLVEKVIQIIDEDIQDRDLKMKIAGRMRRLNEADLSLSSLYK